MLASPIGNNRVWEEGEDDEGPLIRPNSFLAMENEAMTIRFFTKLYTLTEIIGVLCMVLIGIWMGMFRGGFAWTSNPKLEFNWHPLFMALGLIFLYANGGLIYRGFRTERKKKLKIMHACVQFSALIFTVIGLVAVFDSHNLASENGVSTPIPNMYSLHSWMGISVVVLFACQWAVGLMTFLFPGLRPSFRAAYLPIHQFFGLAIFIGAVATALVGITEKAFFIMSTIHYSSLSPEGVLINCIGMCLIVFAGLVVYLLGNERFRRRATEDEILLTDTSLE